MMLSQLRGRCLDAEADGNRQLAKPVRESRQRGPRVQMTFFPEEECLVETSGKVGFQSSNPRAVEPFEPLGAAAELRQLSGIAPMSDDETAVERRPRKSLPPPRDALAAQLGDEGLRTLELAPRRQHATGKPGTAR